MSELPNVQENNEQILNDIQSLQQMEQQLFSNLESNPNLSTQQQQQIIEKMNQLSNMRLSLYQTLSGVNNYFENALNTSIGSLKEQVVAISIVEKELNRSKKRLEILEEEKNNKIRLVEINTYFGDKYAEHSTLMKIIIFTLIPVIILAFLNNKGILPNAIYYGLLGVVSLIGGFFFWKRFASIIMRDNMNYQEYNWYFDPNSASTSTSTSTTTTDDPWAGDSSTTSCVGDACCSTGLTYDASMNQCVTSTSTTTSSSTTTESFITESMVNNILTKKQIGNYKDAVNLSQPEPFNSR
jgi:hypothetical protein